MQIVEIQFPLLLKGMLIVLEWFSNYINLFSLFFHGNHSAYQVFIWLSASGLNNMLQTEQIIYSCVSMMGSIFFFNIGCSNQSTVHVRQRICGWAVWQAPVLSYLTTLRITLRPDKRILSFNMCLNLDSCKHTSVCTHTFHRISSSD